MTVQKLPQMTPGEIETVLRDQRLCRIAFQGEAHPYLAPFQYVYRDGTLYVHLTRYGKKQGLLAGSPRVCVEVEQYTPSLDHFAFVVLRGDLVMVTDEPERQDALAALAAYGRSQLSPEFLLAHGVAPEAGWDALASTPGLTVYKLTRITERVGLRSRAPYP